jgi:hypothetical protein
MKEDSIKDDEVDKLPAAGKKSRPLGLATAVQSREGMERTPVTPKDKKEDASEETTKC